MKRIGHLAAFVAATFSMVHVSTALADVSWTNPAGGIFQDGANWDANSPPSAGDRAVFNLASSYAVQFIDNAQTAGLYASVGQITLDLQGWQYLLGAGVEIVNLGTSLSLLGNYEQTDGGFWLREGASLSVAGSFNKAGVLDFIVESPDFSLGDVAGSSVEAAAAFIRGGNLVQLNNLTTHWDTGVENTGSALSLLGSYQQTDGGFWLREGASLSVAGSFNKAGVLDFIVESPDFSLGDVAGSSVEAAAAFIRGGNLVQLNNLTTHWDTGVENTGSALSLLGSYQQTDGGFWLREGASLSVAGSFNKAGVLDFIVESPDFSLGDVAGSSVEAGAAFIRGGNLVQLNNLTTHWDTGVENTGSALSLLGSYQQTDGGFWLREGASLSVAGSFNKAGVLDFIVESPDFSLGDVAGSSVEAAAAFIRGGNLVQLNNLTTHWDTGVENTGSALSLLGSYQQTGGSFWLREQTEMTVHDSFTRIGAGYLGVDFDGTLQVDSTLNMGTASEFHVDGSVNVGQGPYTTNGILRVGLGGLLAGSGSIFGSLLVDGGEVSPGDSPGTLQIFGNLDALNGGQLSLDIAGTTQGTEYDAMLVSGDLAFDGIINVAFVNGFQPAVGDTFALLTVGGSHALSAVWNILNAPADFYYVTQWENGVLYLTVIAIGPAPGILQQPVSTAVDEGATATFNVVAVGADPLDYQWYHGGDALSDDGRISGSQAAELTISAVTLADIGAYYVEITNDYGSATSKNAYLGLTGDFLWNNEQGGCFDERSNWLRGLVPDASATAQFDLGVTTPYTVTFANAATTDQLRIGRDPVVFDVGGYTYTVAHDITIGDQPGAQAGLTVTHGQLTNRFGATPKLTRLATDPNSTADLVVSGADAHVDLYHLRIGDGGAGSLRLDDGGRLDVDYCYAPYSLGSSAALTVTDPNTTLVIIQVLWLGYGGEATADVLNGGYLNTTYALFVGGGSRGSGHLNIDGAGSWASARWVYVGNSLAEGPTCGSLMLADGGRVEAWQAFTVYCDGRVAGGGTLAVPGTLQNYGQLAPGSPLGVLTVEGDLAQYDAATGRPAGRLEIDLGAAGNDSVQVTGMANLSGTLALNALGGFVPSLGQSFTVLSASGVSGEFTGLEETGLPAGVALDVVYDVDAVRAVARSIASLSISPDPLPVYLGFTARCKAIAALNGGNPIDITASAVWTSDGPNIATIEDGIVRGMQVGSTSVRASFNGFMAAATVDVITPPPSPLSRVSVGLGGAEPNGNCSSPSMSADGRHVAFESAATNLILAPASGFRDVYVYDRETSTMECVSVDPFGGPSDSYSYDPVISPDGRYVCFYSGATNLTADAPNGHYNTFIRDLVTLTTELVTVGLSGTQANNSSSLWPMGDCAWSADNRYLVFYSFADNLVPGDTNGVADVFLYDHQLHSISRVSTDSAGMQANDASYGAALTPDGRYLLFGSSASNLISDDTNGAYDVFLKNLQTGAVERVNLDSDGAQMANSNGLAAMSADARYIVFEGPYTAVVVQLFLRDRTAGTTTLVSVDDLGQPLTGNALGPRITADGRFIAFTTVAPDVESGVPGNGYGQVFLRDMQTGKNMLLSATPTHLPGDNDSSYYGEQPALAAGGRYVAFWTLADDLVPFDMAGFSDIVLWDGATLACRGDTNCDGRIDFFDINPFVQALLQGTFCDGTGANADVNGNGMVDFFDINPFVVLLTQNPLPIVCP